MQVIIMNRRSETVSFGRVTWLLLVVAGIALLHPGYSTAASFLQTPRKYLAVYNNNNKTVSIAPWCPRIQRR